jgi:uncharacterized protein (DUF4213/DUF364 family)
MPITTDYLKIVDQISRTIHIPKIKTIFFPKIIERENSKKSNFGAIQLVEGTIGLVYISYLPEIKKGGKKIDPSEYYGLNPVDLALRFDSNDSFQKTIALGAINSISQYFFKKVKYKFDFTTDSLGLLNLNESDKVGMVGFFPPLVKQIEKLKIPLIVIELKAKLVRKTEKWEVTLDANRLKECNKILITSTTILNDSLDLILEKCSRAEKISILGPTAGFIPDPLFNRKVDVVGGTFVDNSNLFMDLITQDKPWGPSVKKYCIQQENYIGFAKLLEQLRKNDK